METDDRVKQVNWLNEVVSDICWGWFGEYDRHTPAEVVDHVIQALRSEGELPTWFTDHDRRYLIDRLTAKLQA